MSSRNQGGQEGPTGIISRWKHHEPQRLAKRPGNTRDKPPRVIKIRYHAPAGIVYRSTTPNRLRCLFRPAIFEQLRDALARHSPVQSLGSQESRRGPGRAPPSSLAEDKTPLLSKSTKQRLRAHMQLTSHDIWEAFPLSLPRLPASRHALFHAPSRSAFSASGHDHFM